MFVREYVEFFNNASLTTNPMSAIDTHIVFTSKSVICMYRDFFNQLPIFKQAACFDDLDLWYLDALFSAFADAYQETANEAKESDSPVQITCDIASFSRAIRIVKESSFDDATGKYVAKLGFTQSGILRRLDKWAERGILKKTAKDQIGTKPITSYVVQPPVLINNLPPLEKKNTKDSLAGRARLKSKRNQLILAGETLFDPKALSQDGVKSERLFNAVFSSCIRLSSRDPRRGVITTVYNFGQTRNAEKVTIVARAPTDSEIMVLDDQLTLMGIVTIICWVNESREVSGEPHVNSYIIDIRHLCKLHNLSADGGNRQTIRQRLQRIYDTQFEIICPPNSRFAQHFGLFMNTGSENRQIDERHFRFITEMDVINDDDGSLPSMFRISIHSDTYESLLKPDVWNAFSVPEELLRSSGMVFAVYNFASYQLGRTVKENRKSKEYTLSQLNKLLFPSANYSNFKRTFFDQFESHFKSQRVEWPEGKANKKINLFGWFIEFEYREAAEDWMIIITRDLNDRFVGKNSLHNQILTKRAMINLGSGLPQQYPTEQNSLPFDVEAIRIE